MSNKTDRELLELAARAWIRSGMRLECPDDDDGIYVCRDQARNGYTWNPLTDDGDALRLAVALGVMVDCRYGDKPGANNVYVNYWPKGYPGPYLSVYENSTDQLSATRRAIVRAAAAIGESMK